MQVTEINADGLKREYKIIIPAGELEDQITHRLGDIEANHEAYRGEGKVAASSAVRHLAARR